VFGSCRGYRPASGSCFDGDTSGGFASELQELESWAPPYRLLIVQKACRCWAEVVLDILEEDDNAGSVAVAAADPPLLTPSSSTRERWVQAAVVINRWSYYSSGDTSPPLSTRERGESKPQSSMAAYVVVNTGAAPHLVQL